MYMVYLGYFLLTLCLSLLLTPLVYFVMYKMGIVDMPRVAARKIHKKKIPLGGGMAIFVSFFAVVYFAWQANSFGTGEMTKALIGLFAGSLILMVGGFLDDKYNLSPAKQIVFPILAALAVLASGVGLGSLTNPFGEGVIDVTRFSISLGSLGTIALIADAIVFVWLMGMMFTTKFLDGLDGLVTGMVTIGAFVLFGFTTQDMWLQPNIALLSIIFAGACVGFLVWNWHPAKIFLGEGGSLVTGFILGTLAIISGAKIAVTLLVMAVPAIDVLRVIVRRIQKGTSVMKGDNEHLHFKLIAAGFSHRKAVLVMYAISLAIGLSALYLQSWQKIAALIIIFVLMGGAAFYMAKKEQIPVTE